jgi:hypothetical protein
MKNLPLRTLPPVPAALLATAALIAACTSSSGGPGTAPFDAGSDVTTGFSDGGDESSTAEAGEDATADTSPGPGTDSSTSAVDSGTVTDSATNPLDSGATDSGPTDSGSPAIDSGTPVVDSAAPTDGSAACSSLQGTFQATAVSCNGTPISIAGVTWILTVSGSDASFSESINGGCALVSSGSITCAGADFSVLWSNPNTCNPASCSFWGAQCGQTPNEWLGWTTSNFTATTFLATSETEPDGGPTPLATCRAQSLSDPIQITWTKQ